MHWLGALYGMLRKSIPPIASTRSSNPGVPVRREPNPVTNQPSIGSPVSLAMVSVVTPGPRSRMVWLISAIPFSTLGPSGPS